MHISQKLLYSSACRLGLFVATLVVCFAVLGAAAYAASPSPGWVVESVATPTSFSTSANQKCEETVKENFPTCDAYKVTVRNEGSVRSAEGMETVIEDALPAGVTAQKVLLFWEGPDAEASGLKEYELGGLCTTVPVHCGFPLQVGPDEELQLTVDVTVNEPDSPGTVESTASVSGGGAPGASTTVSNSLEGSPSFGFSAFEFFADGVDGARDSQAGDHPYELTTTIALNSTTRTTAEGTLTPTSVEDPRDIVVDLPVGFVGSTLAAPECTFSQLTSKVSHGVAGCPADTIVGHILTEPATGTSINGPIYNMTPERGVPAEFGYVDVLAGAHVFYVHVVPTSKGYVLQTINPNIPQLGLTHIVVTFYGDPAARDATTACGGGGEAKEVSCREALENAQVPFFTNPTDCEGEEPTASIYMDSWQHPAKFNPDGTPVDLEEAGWIKTESKAPPVTGCNALQFPAEIKAQPTTKESDKPSGMNFQIKLPQSETVGALELETPLIPRRLSGEMFLANQNENPFNSTLAAYVVVHDPITGVLIKIAGEFVPDAHNGRLTAVFDENPNLPFSNLELHFFGGPRAELATPESCGTFTTNTELSPYSLEGGESPATPFDNFVIDEACPGGFSPTFTAASTNLQAGAYSPFVASFGRSDTDQELQNLTVTLPPGLLADVGSVPLCGEAQANAGTCPESSQVGTVQTGVGPGPNPLFVGGKAYLTGPYNGGPYGLSVVVPAVAGPYNFGTVVVRQSIRIDPTTAQVTDVSDPFPTIIDGIPLRLRRVDVTLNRPGFTFNPTNCSKLGFSGSIDGTPLGAPTRLNGTIGYATQPGASSSFTAPFQVTNCQTLKFAPKFTVSTTGHTSKALGASLTAKVTIPSGPQGTYANIARVKVDLPKQLPSQLKTLQKACPAKTFEEGFEQCLKKAPASKIGEAIVHTPILAVPLKGPAIFVSHGNEAFPSLTMVLQGGGITIDLVGSTLIKNGITSTTFKTVPDTPFSTFELTLPQGKYAALNTNLPEKDHGNLCGQTLKMPTEFLAQNGAKINESTAIAVTGCKKAKKAAKKHKKAKPKKK